MLKNKNLLRNRFLISRNFINQRKTKEFRINQKLKELINFDKLIISVYHTVKSEVNVFDFTRFLQTAGQTVVLPIILKTNSYLFFKEWILNKQLTSGKFGIKVPSGKFLLKPKILIVPMVAFDKNKNRLGYGGGYYDRTISFLEKENKILKIGIAFDEQEAEIVPTSKFDKKMDLIVTQSRIIT